MNEPRFDIVTSCMLLGLAVGLTLYLLVGQTALLPLGLGSGCLLGFVLERHARTAHAAGE